MPEPMPAIEHPGDVGNTDEALAEMLQNIELAVPCDAPEPVGRCEDFTERHRRDATVIVQAKQAGVAHLVDGLLTEAPLLAVQDVWSKMVRTQGLMALWTEGDRSTHRPDKKRQELKAHFERCRWAVKVWRDGMRAFEDHAFKQAAQLQHKGVDPMAACIMQAGRTRYAQLCDDLRRSLVELTQNYDIAVRNAKRSRVPAEIRKQGVFAELRGNPNTSAGDLSAPVTACEWNS